MLYVCEKKNKMKHRLSPFDITSNTPHFFYNKELCDTIRDIVINSVTSIEDAELYMEHSKNYERDCFIIKKLSNVGMSRSNILRIIIALNLD